MKEGEYLQGNVKKSTFRKKVWCRRGDSNSHRISPTWPWTMRVYQFHHYGIEIIRFLQHGLLTIPETTYEVSYQKLTFQTLTPPIFVHTFVHTSESQVK